MSAVAAVALLGNVLAGVVVLAFWSDARRRGDHRSVVLALAHVLLATAATMSWVVYLIFRSDFQLWVGAGTVVAAAVTGTSTLISSRVAERAAAGGDSPAPVPGAALAVHAACASAAVILVVVAAARR